MRQRIKRRRALAAVVVAALAAGWVVGWAAEASTEWKAPASATQKANPVPADEQSIAAGAALYTTNCLTCHGPKGQGDGPMAKLFDKTPGDLSNPVLRKQTDGALFWKLTEGKTPMPAFDKILSETERWQVVNYLRTLAPKPAATSSQPAR